MGIGAVTVRNTTHFGACSAYSLLALKEDMIGFASTTGGRAANAPGASGTSNRHERDELCCTFRQRIPILLDMATTMAAHGKVEVALRTGQKLPPGWIIDPQGNSITDPKEDERRRAPWYCLAEPRNWEYIKASG